MSESVRFGVKVEDEKMNDKEITAVPFNSNSVAGYETAHKLESFANIREVAQLKKHLGRIEEIFISLAKSWKDSEENHDHVIIYLEEQLKAAKASLADSQLTASEEITTVKEQMKAFQEQMSKQHEQDLLELSNMRKMKEATEQSLQAAKDEINELNANVALHKQRVEQTTNELNKRSKELSAASQEINFLKIQLEAEKDILKTTTKNHDQVISYLKEQLQEAKDSMADFQAAASAGTLAAASVAATSVSEPETNEKLSFSDVKEEAAEEISQEVQHPINEITTQAAVPMQNSEQKTTDIDNQKQDVSSANQENDSSKVQVETAKDTVKTTLQNQGGTIRQSPILTAQQTREQLKMRLQGLQEVNELDKRNKEPRTPVQETAKARPESNNETAKNNSKGQADGQASDLKASVASIKEKAEQDISERDKLNKNLSASSQKIDVFW